MAMTLVTSTMTFSLMAPAPAYAAPVLSVSKSVSKPLLGGTATVSITVTNNGDAKGYNLSLADVISSNKVDPLGRVTITDADIAATSVSLNATTGDTTAVFSDIVDLAPTESHTFTFVVDISGDPSWEVGDLLMDTVTAQVNTVPDNSGTWITGTASASAAVAPIALVTKSANQSTGIHQATGTAARQYSYTIKVQNNYTNPSASVVVTDTIPDGIEFLGQTAGPAPDVGYPQRDPATGITLLKWTIGTMTPGQLVTLTYDTGIRYDYYGTANGGTNRPADDFSSMPATAAIIPNKTNFTNVAGLKSEYKGSLPATITPTQSDSASVTGAYVTVNKSANKSLVGYGTIVTFALSRTTSEYYVSDDATMTDTLPDGLTYVDGSATLAPDSVTHNVDGTTLLVWEPATMGSLGASSMQTIMFDASVDTNWEQSAYAGEPIRAGDTMANTATLAGDWHDQIKPPRMGVDTLVSTVSAGLTTGLPGIAKDVWDPASGSWASETSATVGDTLLYRVRFNTSDGATPDRSDISLGHITLTDWLPPGVVYNNDAVPHYSDAADFSAVGSEVTNIDTPYVVSLGTLSGREWFLGDVAADGWWETTFTVTVTNTPVVAEGLKTGNHWKMTGINTFGKEYSDRDINALDYHVPELTLSKDATSVPSPLVPGSVVGYDITINNTGMADAEDVSVDDTLPVGMRTVPPTITSVTLDGDPLAVGVDYKTSYNAGTGVFAIDFHDTAAPAVDTAIPAGSSLVIGYTSTVDTGVGAGTTLTDLASVSYNTQADGSGRATPKTTNVADRNTDDAVVNLAPLTMRKTGPTGPFRIGESYVYSLEVTVPAGVYAYWPRMVDTLNRDGIYYVPETAVITTVSGTPAAVAAFATTSTPVRGATGTNNSTTLTWDLANYIDNSGQATPYVFRIDFTMQYTGVRENGTQEFFGPGATDRVTNNATVSWNSVNVGARATNMSAAAPTAVVTDIDQPRLVTVKSVIGAGPYAGDSTISYQAVITNTGWARAYDLQWQDILPTYIGTPVLTDVRKGAVSILGSVTPDFSGTPTVTVDFGAVSLGTTETITITYTAKIDPNVPASTVLVNRTDSDWSSLPGTPAGSRRYNDAAWESAYVADSSQATITVASPTIVKSIVGPNPARIGDTVRYSLRVTVPAETVLPGTYVRDAVARDGFTYVNGSAALALVSGSPETSATLSDVTFSDVPNPGSTLRFDFLSAIDNAQVAAVTGDTPYVFDIWYDMVYDGVSDAAGWTFFPPTAGDTVTNTAALHWTVNAVDTSVSSSATENIDQPLLALVKSEASSGPYAGGDAVSYRTVITNNGWATAYDITWQDVLDPFLQNGVLTSVTHSASGDVTGLVSADFTSNTTLTIDAQALTLTPGQALTVDYTAEVVPAVGAGSLLVNTADVDWSSQPGLAADERVYNDGPAEAAYTDDTNSQSVLVTETSVTKVISSGDSTVTVGETFQYTVGFDIPKDTTAYHTVLSDLVPDGLTVISATRSSAIGTLTVAAQLAGQTPVTWDVGNVANPPYSRLELDLVVRVDNAYWAGAPLLDGLPAGVDGDAQDTITNTGSIEWYDADTGGTLHTSTASVPVTVVEPSLTLAKAVNIAAISPAESATYTVTIQNRGTTSAYDIPWRDVLPAGLHTPTLVSITRNAVAMPGAQYSADFSSTPTVTVDFTGPFAAGDTIVITYRATLSGGIPLGTSLTNAARVAEYSTQPGVDPFERTYGPLTATRTIVTRAPVLAIAKSVVGDTQLQVGQTARYRVIVRNTGNAPAYSVNVTDTPTTGLTYVSGSTETTWSLGGTSLADPVTSGPSYVWSFGGVAYIAPGETLQLEYETLVTAGAAMGSAPNTVVSGALDGGGSPVAPVSANASVLITRPGVTIDKHLAPSQDATVQVGQTVTFEYVARNSGTTAIATLPLDEVYDPTYLQYLSSSPTRDSAGVGTLRWNDLTGAGSLAAGADTTVTVTFRVIAHPVSQSTNDTATITAAVDQYGDPVPSATDTATVGITAPSVGVVKSVSAGYPTTLRIGEHTQFDLAVTNTGDTSLVTVPLRDAFDSTMLAYVSASSAPTTVSAGLLQWADITGAGSLAPGATTTVTVEVRALEAVAITTNTASILTSSTVDAYGDTTAGASDDATVTVVQPSLTLAKAVSAASVAPGDTTTYTVTITNIGTGPAYDIPWRDVLPAGLQSPTLVSITRNAVAMPGAQYAADFSSTPTVTVDFTGAFEAGDTIVITYRAVVSGGIAGGTSLTNTARIAEYSTLPGADPGERTYGPLTDSRTIVTLAPVLSITKSVVGDTQLQVGETARYRVIVRNTGDAPAYGVNVTDTPTTGLTYVSGSTEATWSGGGTSAANPAAVGGSLVWSFGGTAYIAPGETLQLEYETLVTAGAALGSAPNTVESGGRDGGNAPLAPVSASTSVLITRPSVSIDKHLAPTQDAFVQVGDTVVFEYSIHNGGTTAIDSLPLDETYDPTYLQYLISSPVRDSFGAGTLHWNDLTGAGSLAAGADTTVTVTFRVLAHPPTSSTTDTATISGAVDEYGDPVPSATDTASVGITAPSVSVTKSVSAGYPSTLRIGETTRFDLVVRNTGDTTLVTVPLADAFDDAILEYVTAAPLPTSISAGLLGWTDATGAGSLAPGAETTITVEMRAIEAVSLTTNTASIAAGTPTDVNGDSTPGASDDATVTVVQPTLTLSKSASVAVLDPGTTATYTVTFENTGNGPAYDIAWSDRIPDELYSAGTSPVLVSVTRNSVLMIAGIEYVADFSTDPTATISFTGPIAAGDIVTVTYRVRLRGGEPAGLSLVNAAAISEYSSLPGSDPDERSYGPLTDATTIVTRAPALSIVKDALGDTELQVGQQAHYRIVVTNTGDAPAYSLTVTDTPPAGMALVSGTTDASWSGGGTSVDDPAEAGSSLVWAFGGAAYIAPGETLTIEYRTLVTDGVTLGANDNTARAGALDGGGVPLAEVNDDAGVLLTRPEVSIAKAPVAGQDPYVQVGETVSFDIVVRNTGTTVLDTIPLEDAYDDTLLQYLGASLTEDGVAGGVVTWNDITGLGSLAVGAETTVTVEFRVTALPPSGEATDVASVHDVIDEYGDPAPDAESDARVAVTRPEVTVTKTLASGQRVPVPLGGEVRYDIVVANTGDTTVTVLPLIDTYDSDSLSYTTATPAPSSVDTGTLTWDDLCEIFGPVAPGDSVSLAVTMNVVGAAAAAPNVATVPDGGPLDINDDVPPGSESTATIDTYDPEMISLTKSANPETGTIVKPGDLITYSIAYANDTGVTFPAAIVTDTLPASALYVPGTLALTSGSITTSLTDDPLDADGASYDAGTRTLTVALGDVAADTSGTVTFDVTVAPAAESRQGVRNIATLSSDGETVDTSGPVDHSVDPLDIIKTAKDVNGGKLAPGDDILWTITVTNTGIIPATNVVVLDTVPANTTYVKGSMTGAGAVEAAAPDLAWNVGTLASGASVVLTFRSKVEAGLPKGTTITNQAVVTADQSVAKYSDAPETTAVGDATLLRTGGDERLMLFGGLAALIAGAFALLSTRRRRYQPRHAAR